MAWVKGIGATVALAIACGLVAGTSGAATLQGFGWNDLDGDGRLDPGEPALADWTIVLEGPGGPLDAQTDATGAYRFEGLSAGSYELSQLLPSGWVQTFPSPDPPADGRHRAALVGSETVSGLDFGSRFVPEPSPATLLTLTLAIVAGCTAAPRSAPGSETG